MPIDSETAIPDLLSGLPCEDLVRQGIRDLAEGRETVAACLVAVASPRLARAGLIPGSVIEGNEESAAAELRLYRILSAIEPDTYARYNSLLRELVSFEDALDHRRRRELASRISE